MLDLIETLPTLCAEYAWLAWLSPWMRMLTAEVPALSRCRQGASGMEYAVFAGMLGMTLLIMIQLFGDALGGAMAGFAHKLQAALSGAPSTGRH